MTNGYSKEDLIIVSSPTADQVSVFVSSASLIGEVTYEGAMRKSSITDDPLRKISSSSIEKKVSFDRGVSIQEEEDFKVEPTITEVETTEIEDAPVFDDAVEIAKAGENSQL